MIAAPVQQKNHRYIDRAVSEWLDVHFGDQSFNGRIFIGHRKHGGGVYTMTARSLKELPSYLMMIHTSQRIDYYITANTVSGTSRTQAGLFGLQNIVIDIDCHNNGANTNELVEAFLWRCERDLWQDSSLPYPNSIVRTGRGVQLWWAINPCHVSCIFYYNQIKTGLMDHLDNLLYEYEEELEGLEIDRAASSNSVGYFRLPCTYNTAARKYGSLQVLRKERYDTHDLAGYISPLPGRENRSEHNSEPQTAIPLQKCDVIVLQNNYTTGAKRVMQLVKLRNLRNNEVGAETRNNLCFSVYNALRMSYDHDEAMERLRAYNEGFKEPMTETELKSTVYSAVRKGGYKYTNEKLIELLEITPDEQIAIGLHPFKGRYQPWGHAKPNATRDAVRKTVRDDRDQKVISMHQEGITQAETARQLGISRNTVSRIIKTWLEALKTAGESLLKNGAIYDCLLTEPCEKTPSETIQSVYTDIIDSQFTIVEDEKEAERGDISSIQSIEDKNKKAAPPKNLRKTSGFNGAQTATAKSIVSLAISVKYSLNDDDDDSTLLKEQQKFFKTMNFRDPLPDGGG